MAKQHIYIRLIPPRPTFAMDMTDIERSLMMQHSAYFAEHFQAGRVLAYGPVLDSGGSFGMGILEVENIEEARRIADGDPTVEAGMTRYTLSPMVVGGCQSSRG